MTIDSLVIAATVTELKHDVVGAHVQRVHRTSEFDFAFSLRRRGTMSWLRLSAHPKFGHALHIHTRTSIGNGSLSDSTFLTTVRHCLGGATLASVDQIDFDRIIKFQFANRNKIGEAKKYSLFIEIMGKHSNIVLVNESGVIIDALKKLSHRVNRHREVLPGRTYINPPQRNLLNPLFLEQDQFECAWSTAFEGEIAREWMRARFALSPTLADELLLRSGIALESLATGVSKQLRGVLWGKFVWFQNVVRDSKYEPMQFFSEKGCPSGAYAVRLISQPVQDQRPCPTMNEAIAIWIEAERRNEDLGQGRLSLDSILRKSLKGLGTQLDKLHKDLHESHRADELRHRGKLLLSQLHTVSDGADQVNLFDYETGETLLINLDSRISPQENAQRWFERYKKLKRRADALPPLIERVKRRSKELEQMLDKLERAADMSTLAALKERAEQLSLFSETRRGTMDDVSEWIKDGILRRHVSDGFELLLGRDAIQNHRLVTELSGRNDLWLHVRNAPSGHGVLRWKNKRQPFTPKAIEAAAAYVAGMSKRKDAAAVDVDYTQVKYVQVVKGNVGKVTYKRHRTVRVAPHRLDP